MNSLLLCLLVVLLPCALALKCDVCTNLPAQAGLSGKPCTAPDVMECPFGMDRCMTINGEIAILGAGSVEFTLKNCSNSALMCAPDGVANFCKIFNTTGLMSSCTTDCCEGDNCNGVSGAEAAGLSVWLASFSAILMALHKNFLN
nr:uncharacterized protein LOC131786411 isoform X2 [Pocillopora verrucosa]